MKTHPLSTPKRACLPRAATLWTASACALLLLTACRGPGGPGHHGGPMFPGWPGGAIGPGHPGKPGGAGPAATSDARLKDVGAPYAAGLDAVSGIRPVTFRYKTGNPMRLASNVDHVGVVAQDLETVLPDAVSVDKRGYRRVHSDAVVWATVNAIRELKTRNEALARRVEDLERAAKR